MNSDLKQAEEYLRQAFQCDPEAVRETIAEFLVSQDRAEEASQFLAR